MSMLSRRGAVLSAATAVAVLAAPAAHAETTLYGSVRLGVNYLDNRSTGRSNWDVVNESSRLGVKGSEDLGGDLRAIYQYEFGVNADGSGDGPLSRRHSWVGLRGGFGQFVIGRTYTPYYNAIGIDDVWNSEDTGITYSFLGRPTRLSDMLIYTTPTLPGGLSVQAAASANGAGNGQSGAAHTADDLDHYEFAAIYKAGALFIGAAYQKFESAGLGGGYAADTSHWAVAGAYRFGDLNLIAAWAQAERERYRPSSIGVTAEYTLGTHILRAAVGHLDGDGGIAFANGRDTVTDWRLGWQYNLSQRSRLWLEYADAESGTGGGFAGTDAEYRNLSIGMRHDF